MGATHEVVNQPLPLVDVNRYTTHRALRDALALHAPDLDAGELERLGATLGSEAMLAHARLAHVHPPVLHTHDRVGHRLDTVEFHPSYHALMALAVGSGLHGTPWAGGAHAHLKRAAGFLMFTETEPATLCPISMTYAVTPALAANPALAAEWGPRLVNRAYDPRFVPASRKAGVTMGMGMTEKQGGSDVRANTTRATPDGGDAWGERVRLTGHKWFLSAPMSDAFLVLAQADAGPTCYFVPRWCPDGQANPFRLQRLKDKLGNRANASAEVEFEDTLGWRVGEAGRGVPQILEMGTLTRLDCALGTAGLMRQALVQALHHAGGRRAFGRLLIEQPLMRNVLADLALESEAATALALRLAHTLDRPDDGHEAALRRVLTPVAKYWVCRRGAAFAQEAMECLGGNGYVEAGGEGVLARIYREMPVNSIWEGAGNVMALDLLRALRREPAVGEALARELALARGAHPTLDRVIASLPARVDAASEPIAARRLAEEIALAMQAALLLRQAGEPACAAFCVARLGPERGLGFGTLPDGIDMDALIARAAP